MEINGKFSIESALKADFVEFLFPVQIPINFNVPIDFSIHLSRRMFTSNLFCFQICRKIYFHHFQIAIFVNLLDYTLFAYSGGIMQQVSTLKWVELI